MIVNGLRQVAMYVWERQLNRPYTWGGDDPVAGFDCSGLVVEGLKAAGILHRKGDCTAQQLYDQFKKKNRPAVGDLVFYGRVVNPGEADVSHVEVVWGVQSALAGPDYRYWTLGATGGGRTTKTLSDAIKHNAFIKIRPERRGVVGFADPFATEE